MPEPDQITAWAEQFFPHLPVAHGRNCVLAVLDGMDGESDRRSDQEQIVNWFENVFHILNAYQIHQVEKGATAADLRMSVRIMELALGFTLAAGAQGPAELASDCNRSKQTVNKCLNHFIAQLNLQPLPFQRTREARENMSRARKEQVEA